MWRSACRRGFAPEGGRSGSVPATRRTWIAFGLLAFLLVAACGNRLPREDIVAAARTGEDATADAGVRSGSGAADGPAGDGSSVGADASTGADADAAVGGGGTGGAGGGGGTSSAVDGGRTGGTPGGPVPGQAAQDATKTPVAIGNIGSYSGVVGKLLGPGEEMAQVWGKWINDQGGLDGHPVRMITADDQGDPAQARALAKQMVEEEGVIAFIGNMTPLTTSDYAQYLGEVGVPAIGGDLTQEAWHDTPILFPQGVSLRKLVFGMVNIAARRGHTQIGVIYCAEVQGCRGGNQYFQEGASQHPEAEYVYGGQVSLAQPNFTSECLEAQSNGVEIIGFAVPADLAKRVMRDCNAQGFDPAWISGGIAMNASVVESPHADGFLLNSMVFPWMLTDRGPTAEYGEAIARYRPDLTLGGASSHVWTSAKLLEAAVEQVGLSGEATAQDVLDGLYALPDGFDTNGLGGPMTFRPGEPPQWEDCYFFQTVEGDRWVAPRGLERECL